MDEKKAAGLQLTSAEQTALQYTGHQQKTDSWEQFLKQRMGRFSAQFGTDAAGFQKYLTDNFGYLYCDPKKFFGFSIDEDAKQIGIPNRDVKLLQKCVDMLKANEQPDLALRG